MESTSLVTLTRTTRVVDHPRPYVYQTTFEVENMGGLDDQDLMDYIVTALMTLEKEKGQKWRMVPK